MTRKLSPSWDDAPRRPRKEAKIKNLPEEDQETLYLLRNPTDDTVPQKSIEECLVYLLENHDLTCAISTFSDWEAGFALLLRNRAAREAAEQAMLEYSASNPDASLEALERKGLMVFTSETIKNKDVLNFTRLRKLRIQDRNADQKDQALAQKDREIQQKDKLIQQNDRRIRLLEQSAAEAKAKLQAAMSTAKSTGGITPETLKQIEEAAGLL